MIMDKDQKKRICRFFKNLRIAKEKIINFKILQKMVKILNFRKLILIKEIMGWIKIYKEMKEIKDLMEK